VSVRSHCCRLRLKCDGTRAETRFRLSTKRTSPFKSAGASVQSPTGSRGVRISGSNVRYTIFRDSVKSTGYPLHSPVSPSLPLPCVTVLIYLLTAIGLSPGGSSTVHIYTQTIHRTKQNRQYIEQHNNLGEFGPCPVLASYTLAFALQLRKKHGKTSVRVAAITFQLDYTAQIRSALFISQPLCSFQMTYLRISLREYLR